MLEFITKKSAEKLHHLEASKHVQIFRNIWDDYWITGKCHQLGTKTSIVCRNYDLPVMCQDLKFFFQRTVFVSNTNFLKLYKSFSKTKFLKQKVLQKKKKNSHCIFQ